MSTFYQHVLSFRGGDDDSRHDLAIEIASDRNFPRRGSFEAMLAYLRRARAERDYAQTLSKIHAEWVARQ